MPARIETNARLDLSPRRIQVGPLHVGESRQVQLTVLNQGSGFLRGTLAVLEGENWLILENGKSGNECLIRTSHEQKLTLRVDTRGLVAPHQHGARLTVITNGGVVEVPVRLDLVARAFDQAPFNGISTPREMAERMRAQPKSGVPLLESGAIALWFAENGWSYPISGAAARGVAAVQQFFEGMGLSKPPHVRLEKPELEIECTTTAMVRAQMVLLSDSRKWVYAQVESGAPWLTIDAPQVSGPQQAFIDLTIHGRLLPSGDRTEAPVRIIANSGQVLNGTVRVSIKLPRIRTGGGFRRPILAGAVAGLGIRLLLAFPADIWSRAWNTSVDWQVNPLGDVQFLNRFVFATAWLGAVLFGLAILRRPGSRRDVVPGLIAGGAAGLAGSATLACVLCGLDALPRWIFASLLGSNGSGPSWIGTVLWIIVAILSWAFLGGIASAALALGGAVGLRIRAKLASSVVDTLRLCGLGWAAAFFAA